jgi:hypothetical protein
LTARDAAIESAAARARASGNDEPGDQLHLIMTNIFVIQRYLAKDW